MSTTVSAVLFSHITVILNYYFGAPNFDAVYVKYPIYNTVFFFRYRGVDLKQLQYSQIINLNILYFSQFI